VRCKFIFVFSYSSVLFQEIFIPKVEREANHLQFQVQESEDGRICNHNHRDWFSIVRRFQARERQVPSPKSQERDASAEAILDEALKKRSSYDRTFRNDKTYKLCFPDGSEVSTLPGTNEPFRRNLIEPEEAISDQIHHMNGTKMAPFSDVDQS